MPNNSEPDYYKVLQVDSSAEHEVIEAAYRRLARKYHPDVYKGPDRDKRMRDFNLAYEVLGDPNKRLAYDARCSRQSTAQKDTSSRSDHQHKQTNQETANKQQQTEYTQGTTSQGTGQSSQWKTSAGDRSTGSRTSDFSHRESPRPDSSSEKSSPFYTGSSTPTSRRTRGRKWFAVSALGIVIISSIWGGWTIFQARYRPGGLSASYTGDYSYNPDQTSGFSMTITSAKQNEDGSFDLNGNFTIYPPLESSGPFHGTLTGQNIQLESNGSNGVSITWVGLIHHDNAWADGAIEGTYTTSDGKTGKWNVAPT